MYIRALYIIVEQQFYYLENTQIVKFIRNYIRNSSGVFSISSLVKISMISLMLSLSFKLYLIKAGSRTFRRYLKLTLRTQETHSFVCLVRFIFTLQTAVLGKPLAKLSLLKILVTSKKLSLPPRTCSFHIWYCSRILH